MESQPTGAPAAAAEPAPQAAARTASADSPYNWIYEQLVTDVNDAVGAFAYLLYKREKIEFVEAIRCQRGREPTIDEMRAFHTQTCTQSRIESYRKNAELLVQAFLGAALKTRVTQYEADVRESVLSKGLDAITAEIRAKKTWGQWARDILGNLGLNVLTILVVGALLGGYHALNRFNTNIESVANIPAQEATASRGSAAR
jgi:hypothetical protein